jgi:hypothetical protein
MSLDPSVDNDKDAQEGSNINVLLVSDKDNGEDGLCVNEDDNNDGINKMVDLSAIDQEALLSHTKAV